MEHTKTRTIQNSVWLVELRILYTILLCHIKGRGSKCKFWEKRPSHSFNCYKKNDLKLPPQPPPPPPIPILRNLDGFPLGTFYSTPPSPQLGTK